MGMFGVICSYYVRCLRWTPSSAVFGKTLIKCHEHFATDRGGWGYLARRWSQVRGYFPQPSLPPTINTWQSIFWHSLANLGVTPIYHPDVSVSWQFHVTLGAELITFRCVTTELSIVPGMWCECEEGRKAKKALKRTCGGSRFRWIQVSKLTL